MNIDLDMDALLKKKLVINYLWSKKHAFNSSLFIYSLGFLGSIGVGRI